MLAVEQWLVTDGETVLSGQPVCEIEMIQLVENSWTRQMCREIRNDSANEISYPLSICSLKIPAQASGIVWHSRNAGKRIECGQPLFEIVEFQS